MSDGSIRSREDRVRIAEKIVELSSDRLSMAPNQRYLALKVGSGAYSNAATVNLQHDWVTFHIPSTELESQANEAGLNPHKAHSARPFFQHKYKFNNLTMAALLEHETLFKAIIHGSMSYVLSQQPKAK